MFVDKYFFVIFLAYLVTFLILFFMSLTTWLTKKKVQKDYESMMNSKASTNDEKI